MDRIVDAHVLGLGAGCRLVCWRWRCKLGLVREGGIMVRCGVVCVRRLRWVAGGRGLCGGVRAVECERRGHVHWVHGAVDNTSRGLLRVRTRVLCLESCCRGCRGARWAAPM